MARAPFTLGLKNVRLTQMRYLFWSSASVAGVISVLHSGGHRQWRLLQFT